MTQFLPLYATSYAVNCDALRAYARHHGALRIKAQSFVPELFDWTDAKPLDYWTGVDSPINCSRKIEDKLLDSGFDEHVIRRISSDIVTAGELMIASATQGKNITVRIKNSDGTPDQDCMFHVDFWTTKLSPHAELYRAGILYRGESPIFVDNSAICRGAAQRYFQVARGDCRHEAISEQDKQTQRNLVLTASTESTAWKRVETGNFFMFRIGPQGAVHSAPFGIVHRTLVLISVI